MLLNKKLKSQVRLASSRYYQLTDKNKTAKKWGRSEKERMSEQCCRNEGNYFSFVREPFRLPAL